MEHLVQKPRNYTEDGQGKALSVDDSAVAHKFWKTGMVRKNEGGTPGKIVGEYVTAKIEVGGGPRQVSVEDLENLLETEEPMVAPSAAQRGRSEFSGPKMTIRLGPGDNEWKRKEIEEIIRTVKGEEKPKRGRPKNADKASTGDGPAEAGAAS